MTITVFQFGRLRLVENSEKMQCIEELVQMQNEEGKKPQ